MIAVVQTLTNQVCFSIDLAEVTCLSNMPSQKDIAAKAPRCTSLKQQWHYQSYVVRHIANASGAMTSLTPQDVRPKNFLQKQNGRNCEAMHNIGFFISGVAANVGMLHQTLDKVQLHASDRVVNQDQLTSFKTWLSDTAAFAGMLDAQQQISRSEADVEELMTKLWKHLGKLDEFRTVLYQLLDLGSRLTGVFQLLTASAIHHNRAGWKAGVATQGIGQKASPEGRVMDKFLKDPKDDEVVVNMLVKGLQEQINKLKKYKSKGQSNQYTDNAAEPEEADPSSSEKTSSDSDSSSSSSKRRSKKTKKHKRQQNKKHLKKSRKSKSTSEESSRQQRKTKKDQKSKRSKAAKESSEEEGDKGSNNFYNSDHAAPTEKLPRKQSKRKPQEEAAASSGSKGKRAKAQKSDGASQPAWSDEDEWWFDEENEIYNYKSTRDGKWKPCQA
jgi:hypothetical protein